LTVDRAVKRSLSLSMLSFELSLMGSVYGLGSLR
jgi:hypothetical protein